MFKILNMSLLMFLYFFQGYYLQYFLGNFLSSRIKNSWSGILVTIVYGIMKMILFLGMPPGYENYKTAIGGVIISLGILTTISLCFYKGFRLITIFLVVAFQAISDVSRYAAVIPISEAGGKLSDLLVLCAEKGIFISYKTVSIAVYGNIILQQIIQYFVIALLLYLPIKNIIKNFQQKDYKIGRTELMFLLAPAATGMMICILLRIIIVIVEDSVQKMLYEKYPVLIAVIPAILLLSLLSVLYGVKLFQDMICLHRERNGKIILEKQVLGLQEHMNEMERIYSGIRSMKHDMRNTVSVIQQLSVENDTEKNNELQAYLRELNSNLDKLEIRYKTGNTVVDTLLNMKHHEAKEKLPYLKIEADKLLFPQSLKIHSYDIGIIIGNAMDNAIEACVKLKEKDENAEAFIRLSSVLKGNLLILKVENSFDGRLIQKPHNEFPETDKEDKKSHGIGLYNIKSTAEKYQGAMDYKVNDRVFILSVMMKNESKELKGKNLL